jgi:hypothetical protein
MNRPDAYALLTEYISGQSLVRHRLSVESRHPPRQRVYLAAVATTQP